MSMEVAVADGDNLLSSLQSLVNSLQLRIQVLSLFRFSLIFSLAEIRFSLKQELESENAKLSSRLSNCTCSEKEKQLGGSSANSMESESGGTKTKKKKSKEKASGCDTSIMNHQCKRYVALKLMYFGQRFYGFASEAQMDPTVESELFGALKKTRLLVGDKKESQYSRCGRTDKGVSSVGQVVALFLRSNLTKAHSNHENSSEVISGEQLEGEIDYVRVLNRSLPNDIRVLGWCPVPIGFSARFSCLNREYKYFFWEESLNLLEMESAGKKFIGEHDFRNFCKMDALNVHNYRRCVSSFEISPTDVRFEGKQLWAIKIEGSAFLWHQVRCMVAVLFMIGQGFESPEVIDVLLDTDRTRRKPQYTMAPEIPLVLHSCEFENLKFNCSSAGQALREHLTKQCQAYHLQAAIFQEALLACLPTSTDQSTSNNGAIKKKAAHIPLMSRPTEPSYAERRAKLNSRS
ncbi:tRNA pseudouridine(38/39) synthase isoform X2 [Morus notabilis]|uniref:tRNA pseudouridine(38/39) synthase isoform X2 n=1 Tax=Morus notabilis TaxID=981085 RepID=UPI000CECF7F6|nr:tRNA pseudouridine(38/39) synthase isoform X2 [Morus notabilis]